MVLSIRYSTIKKKEEAARIEYPAIRKTSFVSTVVYLQREQRAFFTFPTILSRKLILSTIAPSRKTRRTGKLIFFIRGGIIVEGINFYYTCVFCTI